MAVPHAFQEILRPYLPFADSGLLDQSSDLGSLGLDSMSIVALLGDIEDRYDLELPDDILNESTFATVGSLWQALALLLPESALEEPVGT
jgi:acyl carrier protein